MIFDLISIITFICTLFILILVLYSHYKRKRIHLFLVSCSNKKIKKLDKYSTISDTFKKELNYHPEATEDEFAPTEDIDN